MKQIVTYANARDIARRECHPGRRSKVTKTEKWAAALRGEPIKLKSGAIMYRMYRGEHGPKAGNGVWFIEGTKEDGSDVTCYFE